MNKVLFMGRKNVSARLLRYFFDHENIEIVGVLTDSHLKGSPTTCVANELNLPVFAYEEALRLMKNDELHFDLGISVLYWRKLKEEFLSIPSKGVINFHPAPLPEYKGTGGYNLAILEARTTWGVSAHYMDGDIDTGGIIEVSNFDIDKNSESVVSLEKMSMLELENLAKKITIKALNEEYLLSSIENKGGRYVSRTEMESMKEITPNDDVDRKIRAFWFPPYDGAFLVIKNKKYTLVNREILEAMAPSGTTSLFAKKS